MYEDSTDGSFPRTTISTFKLSYLLLKANPNGFHIGFALALNT